MRTLLARAGLMPRADYRDVFHAFAETLARVTETLKVTPLNANSKLSPEHAKLAVAKEDIARLVSFDDGVINSNRENWLERWQREIAPMTSR